MRLGIVGYGNLGKAVEKVASTNKDLEIVGIFSRRKVKSKNKTYKLEEAPNFKGKIDVMFMCGGSEHDLETQTPTLAKYFNVIDSFDTHAKILSHLSTVTDVCAKNKTSAVVCCGWDPGIFSVMRTIYSSIFDSVECFWGKGISLGHTNAIKRVDGVLDAKQYTVPNPKAVKLAKNGEKIDIPKHFRRCYVVADQNHKLIASNIKNIPNYFKGQPTTVSFVSQQELNEKHNVFYHKGDIYAHGHLKADNFSSHFELNMDSNPILTAKILLAYANAVMKMQENKVYKAFTPMQIPPIWLINKPENEIIGKLC